MSMRARVISFVMRHTIKKQMSTFEDHLALRKQAGSSTGRTPAEVHTQSVSANGVPAEWVRWREATDDGAVVYLHGGGYVFGSLDSHRSIAWRLARASGMSVLLVDYRLAPEHPYPATETADICTWLRGAPTHTLAHVITRPHNPLSPGDWRHRGSVELRRLKAWLNEPHSGSAPTGLIGLGPGLSPSGDDILGGLSLALRGREDPRAHWLFDAVTPRLNETHPLSAAHLEAALDGEACEALHFVTLSQASGSSVAKVILQRLAAVGSHSGWDMLLGAALLDLTEV